MDSKDIQQGKLGGHPSPLLLVVGAAMLAACTDGFIREPGNAVREGDSTIGGDGNIVDAATHQGFLCAETSPPPVSTEMKRLTHEELVLVLTDIFGSGVVSAVSNNISLYPKDVLSDPAETYVVNYTKEHVAGAFYLADALGDALAANRAPLQRYGGQCIAAQSPTAECVKTFIQSLGAQVFRRPLTTGTANAEVEQLFATYTGEKTPADGLRLVIAQMMLAPDFWFHLESRGAESQQVVKLTPHEVASRISFAVTKSLPDAELQAAAQNGRLSNRDQVQEQVQRLMQTPRGKHQVLEFFSNWLLLNHFPELSQARLYLDGIATDGLSEEMVAELKRFIEHVVFTTRGKFADLFTNTAMFAKSDRLANIYRAPRWADGQAPTRSTGPHKGMILRGTFLLGEGERTHPILRGVFVRRRMLCDTLPAPSNDVIVQRPTEEPDPLKNSNRMRTQVITQPQQCAYCHTRINPAGFIFENFDTLGRWRDVEKVYSEDGAVVAQHPIDTKVVVEGLNRNKPLETASPEQLNAALGESEVVAACMTRRVFRHLNLREERNDVADNCRLQAMHNKLSSETLFDFFVESVANDSIFSKRM